MPMIRCDADEHYYDDSKHSSCPFCGSSRGNDEKTSFIQPKRDDADKTKLVSSSSNNLNEKPKKEDIGKKEVLVSNDNPKTIAPWQRKKVNNPASLNSSQTIKSEFSGAPVVGWIVIVEGSNKGQDFRIIPGINTIGRDGSNTISMDTGDQEISRDKHCIIEYDVKNGKFYLERGATTTYLNDNRVGGDGSELNIGDIIELGATKVKFIPFCSSEFCWEM